MSTSKILAVLILIVGIALAVSPFAYKMFDRAPAGADMMKDFEPVLTRPNVTTFQGHMVTFQGMGTDMQKMLPAIAQGMGMTPDQLNQMMMQQYPNLAKGISQMPTMQNDFNTVISVMDRNVENFQKANQLPMKNMPWMLLVAGIVLIVLSGAQLLVPAKK